MLKPFGIRIHLQEACIVIFGWVVFCIVSVPFAARYNLFKHQQVRKPTIAEEEILNELFGEVKSRSRFRKKVVHLLVTESDTFGAYAIGARTIAISKGILWDLTADEIKAVLAHELGHMESGDCWIGGALSMATNLAYYLYRICVLIFIKIFRTRRIIRLAVIFYILLIVYSSPLRLPFWPYISIPLYIFIYPFLQKWRHVCWLWIMRYREYRQDAFAHSLGYGIHLISAFHKFAMATEITVNLYTIIITDPHPVMYNRIRRLETLSGLRYPPAYRFQKTDLELKK